MKVYCIMNSESKFLGYWVKKFIYKDISEERVNIGVTVSDNPFDLLELAAKYEGVVVDMSTMQPACIMRCSYNSVSRIVSWYKNSPEAMIARTVGELVGNAPKNARYVYASPFNANQLFYTAKMDSGEAMFDLVNQEVVTFKEV